MNEPVENGCPAALKQAKKPLKIGSFYNPLGGANVPLFDRKTRLGDLHRDVVQEMFRRPTRYSLRLRLFLNPKTYAFRVARNLAILTLAICFFSQLRIPTSGQTPPPKIIENPEHPKYAGKNAPELLFERELSIPLEGRRYSFDVDDEGYIYLLDTRGASISVYDKSGKFLTRFGRKGQGPGEFENPVYLAVSKEDKIHVIDRSRRTIQVFDKKGNVEGHYAPISMGGMTSLVFDSGNSAYITDNRNLYALQDEARIKRGVTALSRLRKFDNRFGKGSDVETWDNLFMKRVPSGEVVPNLYHDVFYYQVDRDNNLYYGHSSRYEIHQLSSEGRVEKIIRKKAKRIPTTTKDRTLILENYPDLKEAAMAATKPYFLDFHVLDKIGFLVSTYEEEWNDQGIFECDLFDRDGVYIAKVRVPRYYTRDHDIMSEQRNRLFKNGYCYSIIYNDKRDTLELVRHSVRMGKRGDGEFA
jgi:hypothetical protein